MNLLLLSKNEVSNDNKVILKGRRQEHIRKILKLGSGDQVRVGVINGLIGTAEITRIPDAETIELELYSDSLKAPPPIVPCKVILAMPRPKMMRRVIQNLSSLGIKDIHLINAWRVEKSFWQTPWLNPEKMKEQLALGLEQSMDTAMPKVHIHKLFKPFVEDVLPSEIKGSKALVAHPYTKKPCPVELEEPSTLIIGPEGGFTPYEVNMLHKAGVEAVNIGPRILRVETVIPVLISRLYPAGT